VGINIQVIINEAKVSTYTFGFKVKPLSLLCEKSELNLFDSCLLKIAFSLQD